MKNKKIVKSRLNILMILLLTCFITIILSGCGGESETINPKQATDLKNGMRITLTQALPACTTLENLKKFENAISANNKNLQNEMIFNGEFIGISTGEKIDIIDFGIFKTEIQYNSLKYFVSTCMISDK
ncbi:MAG: hypothetical protein ACI8WT_004093 [Clostridium sp.]|jgi:hypothetical protein